MQNRFLLAKLHLDSLKGKRSPRELRKTLATLAKGTDAYNQAYCNTMERICGQIQEQKELAIETLSWIVHAKRSLTTIELQHALGVEKGEPVFFEDNIPDLQDAISACCGLVAVDEESNIVRLAHYTTQEFFEKKGDFWLPNAEVELTNTCVTYLSFDSFSNGRYMTPEDYAHRLVQFPLYHYSSRFWGYHARIQENSKQPEFS